NAHPPEEASLGLRSQLKASDHSAAAPAISSGRSSPPLRSSQRATGRSLAPLQRNLDLVSLFLAVSFVQATRSTECPGETPPGGRCLVAGRSRRGSQGPARRSVPPTRSAKCLGGGPPPPRGGCGATKCTRGSPAAPPPSTDSAPSRTRSCTTSCRSSRRGRWCAPACSRAAGATPGPPRRALTSALRALAASGVPAATATRRRTSAGSCTACCWRGRFPHRLTRSGCGRATGRNMPRCMTMMMSTCGSLLRSNAMLESFTLTGTARTTTWCWSTLPLSLNASRS
ncbi:Os08g0199100, partial [Oryza sativa Japonica Group]